MTKTTTSKRHTEHSVPILESGDRLTRYEFERRYQSMPHLKKAELIEGVVYVASPLRYSRHGQPHSDIITWLGVYRAATPGIGLADNTTVRLDLDNEPQPDALLRIETDFGGQSRISVDDYYISFRKPQRANDSTLENNIIYHYRDKTLVGITVLRASATFGKAV
jgi:hypothetical protein